MAVKKSKTSPFVSQATAASLVRYGPSLDALKELMQQTNDTYQSQVGAARGTAVSTEAADRAALPVLNQIYDQAAANGAAQVGALTPASGTVEAALNREGAAAKAAAVNAIPLAESGKGAAINLAGATLQQNLRKIDDEQLSLTGQAGAFTQAEIDKLGAAAAAEQTKKSIAAAADRTSTANNVRTNKTSTDNNKRTTSASAARALGTAIGAESKPPKPPRYGPGSLTQAAESKIIEQVRGATASARLLMAKPKANPSEVRFLLATGAVDGTKYNHDEINAAFDLLPPELGGKGGLSEANIKALHGLGIHVKGNFPIYKATPTRRPRGKSNPLSPTFSPSVK